LGVRLNLTAANRIFIVELQWNPSVENQAIARAIRLRQSEKVVVTRYIMKDTVEQVSHSLLFSEMVNSPSCGPLTLNLGDAISTVQETPGRGCRFCKK
jgi:hypothetical protein